MEELILAVNGVAFAIRLLVVVLTMVGAARICFCD